MKPEIKLFPLLKDDSRFPQWQRAFRMVCHATDMGETIDPDYRPSPHEAKSFRNKVHWLFNVLAQTVHTIDGRNILYNNLAMLDGRAAYLSLCSNAVRSTAAQLHTQDTMQELVNARLTKSYPHPYTKFVSDYIRKLNTYNERVSTPEERLSEAQMRTLLEAAVSTAKPLYEVRRNELMDIAKGKPRFTLSQYAHLLNSVAQTMDRERKASGR